MLYTILQYLGVKWLHFLLFIGTIASPKTTYFINFNDWHENRLSISPYSGLEKQIFWRYTMVRLAVLLLAGATFVAAQTTTTTTATDTAITQKGQRPALDSAMAQKGQRPAMDSTKTQRPERDTTVAKDTAQHKGAMVSDSAKKIVDQLKQKFEKDNDNDSAKSENCKVRDSVAHFAKQIRDTSKVNKVVADSLLQKRKGEANVRIQGAIDAMTQKGDKVGTQVQVARERIQARIVEKRQELIDQQKTILDRQNARKTAKEDTDTTKTN